MQYESSVLVGKQCDDEFVFRQAWDKENARAGVDEERHGQRIQGGILFRENSAGSWGYRFGTFKLSVSSNKVRGISKR